MFKQYTEGLGKEGVIFRDENSFPQCLELLYTLILSSGSPSKQQSFLLVLATADVQNNITLHALSNFKKLMLWLGTVI